MITGRVVDERTGAPVRAKVGYLPMYDNPAAAQYPNFVSGMRTLAYSDFRWTESEGAFRVPAIQGRGVLCVAAERQAAYALAGQVDSIQGLQKDAD
jgi:hypothetical protein